MQDIFMAILMSVKTNRTFCDVCITKQWLFKVVMLQVEICSASMGTSSNDF